ncbi:hypothetical protein [Hyalangium versicolor]|uniref:hypothetical protein n=1 Tax=Hyalangium versicolor TaxID=2861190 RepID=UPI001CC91B2A|nr:hypothetical protein [Hyalangium versicolor]
MRPGLPALFCWAALVTGCSHFGYYKYEKPEWTPPEEGAKVQFLNSLEGGARLSGPMMVALKAAMDDYRPPGMTPESQKSPEGQCLARWEYINTTVFQASDDVFYVLFAPDLSQCGPGFIVFDAGAEYAIDGKGRILAKQ